VNAPCSGQSTAAPVISQSIDGFPIPERKRAVAVSGGQTAPVVSWVLSDPNGRAVDLTTCGSVTVTLLVRDGAYWSDLPNDPAANSYTGTVTAAAAGAVQATIDPKQLGGPGIYDAEFAVYASDGTTILFTNLFSLIVERSLFGSGLNLVGPPTRAEIRLALRDSSHVENRLLDLRAYDDAELAAAMVRAVDDWNDELPILARYTHSVNDYPYRNKWLDGIVARLHLLTAEEQLRNELPVVAGGIEVNDQNKHQLHMQVGQKMLDDYRAWIRLRKLQLNIGQCWGSLGSSYGRYSNRVSNGNWW